MNHNYYVYVILDPRDSQPFYVGKGEGQRMMRHEVAARGNYKEAHMPHHDRIREILSLGMQPMYEKVMFNVDEITALTKEEALIAQYGRQWNGTGILLNKSPGGYNSGRTEKPVCQYDLQGNFLAEFKSVKIASEQTGANASYISACCKNVRKSAGSFQWTYAGAEAPTEYSKAKFNPVTQFDLEGNVIQKYKSLTDAQEATGIELHCISEACRGKSQTAGGFKWAYSSNVP